jgi:hypothetical protein
LDPIPEYLDRASSPTASSNHVDPPDTYSHATSALLVSLARAMRWKRRSVYHRLSGSSRCLP